MFRVVLFLFCLCCSASPLSLFADPDLPKCTDSPVSALVRAELEPGLQLLMLPLESDEDELLFRAVSSGGYADFSPDDKASIVLAPQIGRLSLSESRGREIELVMEVHPFSQTIEVNLQSDELPSLPKILGELFDSQAFNSSVADSLLARSRTTLLKTRDTDELEVFEALYRSKLFAEPQLLSPISQRDLERFSFIKAREYYFQRFLSPQNYTFILVGKFDPDKALRLFREVWAGLSKKNREQSAFQITRPQLRGISPGIQSASLSLPSVQRRAMRLIFPIEIEATAQGFHSLQRISQVIETKLRHLLTAHYGHSRGVDVAFEFPLVTSMEPAYLLIQVRQLRGSGDEVAKLIVRELKSFSDVEADDATVEGALRQLQTSRELWMREGSFWLSSLSNFVLWGFDPSEADAPCSGGTEFLKLETFKFAKKNFSIIRCLQLMIAGKSEGG